MRILYLPLFTNRIISGCSSFNSNKLILLDMVKAHEDVVVYYVHPNNEEWDITGLSYIDHPRIIKIGMKCSTRQAAEIMYSPSEVIEKFRSYDGEYLIDVFISERQRSSYFSWLQINEHIKASDMMVPLLNVHQFQGVKADWLAGVSEEFEFMQMLGGYSGYNVFPCKTVLQEQLNSARRYLKPHIVERVLKRSRLEISSVINFERVLSHCVEKPKDRTLVSYGSRFGSTYDAQSIFHEVDLMHRAGRDIKIIATVPNSAPGGYGYKVLKEAEHDGTPIELHIGCPQTRFYELASQCHIAPHFEIGELSLSPREQMIMGCAVMTPKKPIWYEILGKQWPFMYENNTEMQVMFRYLVDNYWSDEVQQAIKASQSYIKEMFDSPVVAEKMYDFLVEIHGEARITSAKAMDGWRKVVSQLFDEHGWPEEISFADFSIFLKKNSATKKDTSALFKKGGNFGFHCMLLELGYEDIGIEHVVYRRKS